ncbi:MAG TPA: hypothetical protein VGR26_03285 [Acidimicrobiales bacterium]|nr:hypothetical protein [Acidimicrobiales bacterium]
MNYPAPDGHTATTTVRGGHRLPRQRVRADMHFVPGTARTSGYDGGDHLLAARTATVTGVPAPASPVAIPGLSSDELVVR